MKYLIIGILAGIVISLIVYISKNNKIIKEQQREANKKHKDESLMKALANPFSEEIPTEEVNYKPYKVTYVEKEKRSEVNDNPMLQIIENSENAIEKFLFKSNSRIYIGLHLGKVTIVKDEEEKNLLSEIYYSNEGYCVVSKSKSDIFLKRGSKSTVIDEKGYVLKSGDIIRVNNISFTINYIYT